MKLCICHTFKYFIGTVFFIGFFLKIAVADVALNPHISVGNMYTDNLDLSADDEAYDFITSISPEMNIIATGRFTEISLSYTPTYASYLRFPENNTLRHNALLDASRQMTRSTRLEISDNYLYTEDPLSATEGFDSGTDTTVRQGRNPYTTNMAAINLRNQFGPDNTISLGDEYYFLNNTDSTIENLDYHRPSITMNYWLVPNRYGTESEIRFTKRNFDISEDHNDVYGRLRLTRRGPHFDVYIEYTHELTDYVADGEDYQVFSPLIGFSWNEYRNSSFIASFGYFFRKNDHSGSDSGPVGTIDTHYTWEQGISVSISGIAGYDRASSGAQNLGFNPYYSVTGNLAYPLSRHLNSHISAGYRWNIYTDEEPDRDDTIWTTGAGLTYQALPWMIVSVNYIFRELDSDIDVDDYVENRAEISVTLNPRQPVMLTH